MLIDANVGCGTCKVDKTKGIILVDHTSYGMVWARSYMRTNFGYRLKDRSKQAVVKVGEWFDPLTPAEVIPN